MKPRLLDLCRNCKKTEQECAYSYPCCAQPCSHWRNWTSDGEPIPKSPGGRPLAPVIDAVTAKRREQWRNKRRWAS